MKVVFNNIISCMSEETRRTFFEVISRSEDKNIRFEVAQNHDTPTKVLAQLAEDEFWVVRYAVAKNPNTSTDILIKLSEDEHWVVRHGVVCNDNLPLEVLDKLSKDSDPHVCTIAQLRLRIRTQ